jgi:hypothetical protein
MGQAVARLTGRVERIKLSGDRLPQERYLVIAALALTTVARLVYGLAVNDPASGPDAPTYGRAAEIFASDGPLAHAPGIPYWPAGYPLLLAPLYAITGNAARFAMAVQVVVVSVGTYFAWTLVRRELGGAVAGLTVAGLCLSPALAASSSELMYEGPLLAGLAIGLDLLSRASRAGRGWQPAAAGALVLGLAATMQPKALLPALLAIALVGLRRRSVALSAIAVAALAVGPLALAARTQSVDGRFALSANLGPSMVVGLGTHANQCTSKQREDVFTRDRRRTSCAVRYLWRHPGDTVVLMGRHAVDFWAPFTGPFVGYRRTWFHNLSFRRLLPAGIRTGALFKDADSAVSIAWMAAIAALAAGGLLLGLRNSATRSGTIFLALPVLSFLAISLVVEGDARFRLPVAPYYIALQGIALVAIWRLGVRRRARRAGSPARRSSAPA